MYPLSTPPPRLPFDTHPASIRLYDELIGSSHGQTDHTLLAYDTDGAVLGYLQYSVFRGQPLIHSIMVIQAYRRRGIGTMLVCHLQAHYPSVQLDWGWTTQLGEALKQRLAPSLFPQATHSSVPRSHI